MPNPAGRPPVDVFTRLDVGLCWEWMGATIKGYGVVRRGRAQLAHRFIWEQLVAPIPPGLELDHLCRNTLCCNPDHLEPVTHAENMRRSAAGKFAAALMLAKTHCPANHPYDSANTYITPAGGRACRTCRRQRNRAYRRMNSTNRRTDVEQLNELEEEERNDEEE